MKNLKRLDISVMRRLGLAIILAPILICGFSGLFLVLVANPANNAEIVWLQSHMAWEKAASVSASAQEKNQAMAQSEFLLISALRYNSYEASLWYRLSDFYAAREQREKKPANDFSPAAEASRIARLLEGGTPPIHIKNER